MCARFSLRFFESQNVTTGKSILCAYPWKKSWEFLAEQPTRFGIDCFWGFIAFKQKGQSEVAK